MAESNNITTSLLHAWLPDTPWFIPKDQSVIRPTGPPNEPARYQIDAFNISMSVNQIDHDIHAAAQEAKAGTTYARLDWPSRYLAEQFPRHPGTVLINKLRVEEAKITEQTRKVAPTSDGITNSGSAIHPNITFKEPAISRPFTFHKRQGAITGVAGMGHLSTPHIEEGTMRRAYAPPHLRGRVGNATKTNEAALASRTAPAAAIARTTKNDAMKVSNKQSGIFLEHEDMTMPPGMQLLMCAHAKEMGELAKQAKHRTFKLATTQANLTNPKREEHVESDDTSSSSDWEDENDPISEHFPKLGFSITHTFGKDVHDGIRSIAKRHERKIDEYEASVAAARAYKKRLEAVQKEFDYKLSHIPNSMTQKTNNGWYEFTTVTEKEWELVDGDAEKDQEYYWGGAGEAAKLPSEGAYGGILERLKGFRL